MLSSTPDGQVAAYLTNQYPHVSHSFIRREITALEALGIRVARFSIRNSAADLVDPADRDEQRKTRVVLAAGFFGFLIAVVRSIITYPVRCLKALRVAISMGRRSHRGVARHFAYFAEACWLVRELRSVGAKHLHAHFGTNPAAVALFTRILGGPPFSFTVHGPEEFDKPEALSLGLKIHHAAAVVAVSDFGRSQLLRWCQPSDWPKIRAIRCGVDAAFLNADPKPVPDTNRLVCVGRLCEQKGQLLLLESLADLRASGDQAEIIFAGDGPLRGVLENRIAELSLKSAVRITGWLSNEEVRREILAARVLVLPSIAEGLPVVIMEALAMGRPVISTYVAGIPELVRDGENGWLAPAGSKSALVQAMRRALATSVDRLTEMGSAGARRVVELHDVNKNVRELVQLFGVLPTPAERTSHCVTVPACG